jgi:uncharacterized protein (TIGR02594 family)
MAAGTVTPTEAGQGPGVLNIAANIGAKIRDAADEAKQEREKAQEKGMQPKKGSLFKSALGNKFNPIKSKKSKAGWSKQFDWNKKSPDTAQQVKTPSETGGADGKAKLKEFIAGGFTAIIKDTTAMRSKMDGIQGLSSANLEQATRTTGSLTMIKESVDAQTEIRRKALEQAKFAKSERRLERTKDSAGVKGTGGPGGSKKKKPGETPDDDGGGLLDKILTGLGIGDLLSNFLPKGAKGGIGQFFSKLNPFKKGPKTKGGKPITGTGTRPVTGGARVTGGTLGRGGGMLSRLRNVKPGKIGRGGLLSVAMLAADLFMPEIQDGLSSMMGSIGVGDQAKTDDQLRYDYLSEEHMAAKLKETALFGMDNFTDGPSDNRPQLRREFERRGLELPTYGGTKPIPPKDKEATESDLGQYGGVPEGYKLDDNGKIVKLNRGGIVDNPTRTMLYPGDKVIPLNRSAGKDMLSEGSGDLPMQAQAAMILGVSTGMLGQSMSGTTGDTVKQRIRAASKGFGISNLNFTSNVGSGKLGKVDMNQSSENFMKSMLKHFKMAGGKTGGGDKPDTDGGGGDPPAPAAAAGLKGELEADLGKNASQMKNEIMQSGAGGVVNPTEQPWCAAYVNSQLKRQGIMGSGSAAADSYSDWGAPVDKAHIKYGDVIVGDYGGGSKTHVMFAAGSPRDGAVDIIGGNQSGRVSAGKIQLNKIDYVRRASDSVVVPQPDGPQPAAEPVLPGPDSVNREAESGGVFSTIKNFFGLAKDRDHKVSNKTQMGQVVNSLQSRRKRQEEMMRELGFQGGGRGDFRKNQVKSYNPNRKYKIGDYVKKDGKLLKFDGMGFAGTSAKSVTSQNLTPGAPAPKPAPLKKTPEQVIPPRQPAAASTAAAVVMPPTQNVGKKTASAAGSFGSSIPSAKVAAGNFADFLYLDLV